MNPKQYVCIKKPAYVKGCQVDVHISYSISNKNKYVFKK